MFWIVVGIIVALLCYIYLIKPQSYWKNKGVIQTKPLLIVGDTLDALLKRKSLAELVIEIYKKAGDNRYFGFYQGTIPTLLIRDPELLKQMTVKDFDHFQDRKSVLPDNADPIWVKNLFALKGQKWKEMRSTLSPLFTSSKMRFIYIAMSECAESVVKYFLVKSDAELKNLEMKDIFTRFANDVIASLVFGIKCDSLTERENPFYTMVKKATDFSSFKTSIKLYLMVFVPQIAEILRLQLFPDDVQNFFRNIVNKAIQTREEQGIVRPDMLQLLIEAKKNSERNEEQNETVDTGFATARESDVGRTSKQSKTYQLTNEDITSQAFSFFTAGFDTVASLMSFLAYELALNPDIQEKLIQEIDETRENSGEKVTYEAILKMKYLDMVVSETLRKWPIAAAIDRTTTKPFTIQPEAPKETAVQLDVNDVVWMPIFGIHRDPEHYPNPDKFDPERFSDENKRNIKPYTYLPFGSGPRNCIGSRFALLETKAVFFHLLSHFEIAVTEKTEIPIQLNRKTFAITAANGFWLQLKRRYTVHQG